MIGDLIKNGLFIDRIHQNQGETIKKNPNLSVRHINLPSKSLWKYKKKSEFIKNISALGSGCIMKIITVNTYRGGSGKSLFTILLSKYLPGKKLLIDTDGQNSLSFWSGAENNGKNVYKAIMNQDVKSNIQKVNENVDIIISDIRITDIEANLEPGRFDFIKEYKGKYDWVLIDTHPTWNGVVYNAVQISDIVVCPVMLDMFSFKSLAYTIGKIEKNVNKKVKIKVIVNQLEKQRSNNAYSNQLLNLIRKDPKIKKYLSKTMIPKNIIFKQINDTVIEKIPENKKNKELLTLVKSLIKEVV